MIWWPCAARWASCPHIVAALEACPDKGARDALGVAAKAHWIDEHRDVHALLARACADDPPARASEGNVIRDGFDAELDESRLLARDGQRMMVELEARLRESSGIGSLKLRYTRVFGWYIEVTRAHLDKAPPGWRRKQTIANGERFTSEELDALADKMAHAEERCASREAELYVALVRDLAKHAGTAPRGGVHHRRVGRRERARRSGAPFGLRAPRGLRVSRARHRGRSPPGRRDGSPPQDGSSRTTWRWMLRPSLPTRMVARGCGS